MGRRREQREFLAQLWADVNDSVLRARRGRHPFEDEYEYHLGQLARAMRLVRAIRAGVGPDDLRDEFISDAVREAQYAVQFNTAELERSGVLLILDQYFSDIGVALRTADLPTEEAETLRARGFPELADHLAGAIHAVRLLAQERARWGRGDSRPSFDLNRAAEDLAATAQNYQLLAQHEPDSNAPDERKGRRWFKGFGQIVQGTAMSLADIGLAAGCFHFPVSAETQTWGALTSITAGVGTIMNGAGDLRGE